ncbi:MAG TPA: DMT family transporter [Hyphomicrobiaceae bacterium]|nr:DMT family transporter [Hyphomicrobiaceae bacterium]
MRLSDKLAVEGWRAADRLDAWAVFAVVACCASWGVNQVAIKAANAGISPVLQAGLRSGLAAVLVLAWARARRVRLFERDRTLWLGLLAGLLFGLEFVSMYVGLAHTTASRGVVLLYLAPFVVAFGAHFLIPGDRLTLPKIGGLTAALAGLAVAMGEGLAEPGRPTLLGDLLSLTAAVMWGATTVFIRSTALGQAPHEKVLLYQLSLTAVILPPLSWAMGEPGITEVSLTVLAAFAYTVVVVAFASYVAWFWLVRNYPPTRVASFTFLSPVFGVIAGSLMLGEPFTASLAAALALITFGIYLVNRPARR